MNEAPTLRPLAELVREVLRDEMPEVEFAVSDAAPWAYVRVLGQDDRQADATLKATAAQLRGLGFTAETVQLGLGYYTSLRVER